MRQDLNIVILAAGAGKRMNSALPKVLQKISAKPMLAHVIDKAVQLSPAKLIVVYGHGGELVKEAMQDLYPQVNLCFAKQIQQLGTGDALKAALPYLTNDGMTLVLYGDVPLIALATLELLLRNYQDNLVLLSAQVANPTGYGRIVRDLNGLVVGVVEEKDASVTERAIDEINTGFYVLPNKYLGSWLNKLNNKNEQQEYYLTDVVGLAAADGVEIKSITVNANEVMGVNNKQQLQVLERVYQLNQAQALLAAGVTLFDAARIDVRGQLLAGRDCSIDVNCVFEGKITLGDNVNIGMGCYLKNVQIANNVTIHAYSLLEDVVVADGAQIGPYARLRPGSKIASKARIGNFVEIKNTIVGESSKVNHLTYVGDAVIGTGVNIGAGCVTCNYDGKNKYLTKIEDNVFVGSGTMIVAPVTISHNATIGAGSVITKDTPANELTVARAKQTTIYGWKPRYLKD